MSTVFSRLRAVWALIRATALTAMSYRFGTVMKIVILIFQVVPTYYIGVTLQPLVGPHITGEGGQFFPFLLTGTVALLAMSAASDALPRAIESATQTGTLEALLATPLPVSTLLAGLAGYDLLWALARSAIIIGVGTLFGAHMVWANTVQAVAIVLMIALAYYPVSLVVTAMIIAFRRPGPVQTVVIVAAGFFSGVTYPIGLLPGYLRPVSLFVPLTYGVRALRRVFLDGASIGAVLPDLAALAAFIVVGFALGTAVLTLALSHARRAGSLAQY